METIQVEKGQVVHLTWYDSSSLHGWVYEDVAATPKEIESVGFIVAVGEDAIAVTSGRSDSGGVINPLTIPICCIRKYKVLEV